MAWVACAGFSFTFLLAAIHSIQTKVPTLWDDYDYQGLVKRDFQFTAESTGREHFAYLYTKEGINIDDGAVHAAIIGLHGWGNHHREMDRYALPTIQEEGYLYFTYDAQGQGLTSGDLNDLDQISEAEDFIEHVKSQPFVDKSRVCVMGMSMGAAKTAVAAYPDPDVKIVLMYSGPYDFPLTIEKMGLFEKIAHTISKFSLKHPQKQLEKYSGINYFRPDGVVRTGDDEPTPNSDRVFMAAALDDPLVHPQNTLNAIEKLDLREENYCLYKGGGHTLEGNEWSLAVSSYKFIKERL